MSERTPLPVKEVSDSDLLDEIDDIILSRLQTLEAEGKDKVQVKRWVAYYGRMYDVIYGRLLNRPAESGDDLLFREEVYEFLVECFWSKIEAIYDPDMNITEAQANQVIGKTRAKLKRVEAALFASESTSIES